MTNNTTNTVKFYSYSDSRSAKSCITIEQTPEIVQYIESNAARMGVPVQAVVDAIITARYNNCRYNVRTEKAPMDRTTYELRKQLELAQCRPADDEIEWRGYKFYAKNAADILKRLNGQFSKPSKKQLLLFESEIAADAAPVQEQQPEPTPAPVEDIEAAALAHFEELAANAPTDDPAAPVIEARPEPMTPASEKTEPAPVKKPKEFAEYHGAIVEIIERREDDAVIKYKFGACALADYDELKPTTAKKTAFPEWLQPFYVLETDGGKIELDAVGQKNMVYLGADGFYYKSTVAAFIGLYGDTVKSWHIKTEFEPDTTPANEKTDTPADNANNEQPRFCFRLRPDLRPRLSRWLHPLRWVAVVLAVCIVSSLLIAAANSSTDDTNTTTTDTPANEKTAYHIPEQLTNNNCQTPQSKNSMNTETTPQEQHCKEVFIDFDRSLQQLRQHHGLTIEEAAARLDMSSKKLV